MTTLWLLIGILSVVIFGREIHPRYICRGLPSESGVCSYAMELPFLVSIQMSVNKSSTHICSGSIISLSKVLTTGSCFQRYGKVGATSLRIIAGIYNLQGEWDQIRDVGSLNIHPHFTGTDYDYAVLSLTEDLEINPMVIPDPLAGDTAEAFIAQDCMTVGWRLDVTQQDGLNQLQSAPLDLVEFSFCREEYSDQEFQVHDRSLCAHQLGKIAHDLDDGGPLICNSYIVGAATYPRRGNPCEYPSFFANTAKVYDWIMSA